MKKIFFIPVIFILALSSCDVLDVEPAHSIPADQAITNAKQVERGIIGCYDAMQSGSYYGLNFIAASDLAADDLKFSGTTISYAEINNNNILADNGIVEGIWASIYNVLNRVNNVIARIPGISDMDESQKNAALAELRFLRALAHYDLMRLFGGVPIRTIPASGDDASLNIPRSSVDQVLAQVNTDLDFAIQHMVTTIVRGRASKAAAQALKSRVALHQYYLTNQISFLETAKSNAGNVIASYNLSLLLSYSDLFTGLPNNESIFELEYNEQDGNRLAQYFFHTNLSGRYEFSPTDDYLNSFTSEDVRKNASVKMSGAFPYVFKYNDILTGTDNAYIFRLAEMYLIRAEAEIKLQGDMVQIRNDINAIRNRADLPDVTLSDYNALLLEVETQRRKEFAFEGHRWFDLVRTGRAVAVIPTVTEACKTLFPIPLGEIQANTAINPEHQNPCY